MAELMESNLFAAKLNLINVNINWKLNPQLVLILVAFGRDWYKFVN